MRNAIHCNDPQNTDHATNLLKIKMSHRSKSEANTLSSRICPIREDDYPPITIPQSTSDHEKSPVSE